MLDDAGLVLVLAVEPHTVSVPRVRIWLASELLASCSRSRIPLLSPANLLSFRLQGCFAGRAFVTMAADVDSLQAFGASPPGVRGIAAFEPIFLGCDSTLLNVLLVKVSQVVAEVIATVERISAPPTAGVIAMIRVLLRRRSVLVLVVTVQIGTTLEGLRIAARVEATYWIVTATRGKCWRFNCWRGHLQAGSGIRAAVSRRRRRTGACIRREVR